MPEMGDSSGEFGVSVMPSRVRQQGAAMFGIQRSEQLLVTNRTALRSLAHTLNTAAAAVRFGPALAHPVVNVTFVAEPEISTPADVARTDFSVK